MENFQILIKAEMITHIPVNTHPEPKRFLVINGGKRVQRELEKYNFIEEIIHLDELNAIENLHSLLGATKVLHVAIVYTAIYTDNRRRFWIELY